MKRKLVNISSLILGLISGPFALVSAKAAQPPIDWPSVIFALVGCFVGALFVIGIQIFRREPKYGCWALGFFMPASIFFLSSGLSALIVAIIRSELGPASFLFIIASIGLMVGVLLSRNIYHRKFKNAL
jgi:hypothetical protein